MNGVRMNPSGNSIRTTALALLFLVSFFNYMDRYMLAVLLPAIKADLQLSDTEIGFITGLAFTLFYVTMGIPIARLADRYNRKNIIAIALTVWRPMDRACGPGAELVQWLARVPVGWVRRAPVPAHSLGSPTCFPRGKRARALSVYSLGGARWAYWSGLCWAAGSPSSTAGARRCSRSAYRVSWWRWWYIVNCTNLNAGLRTVWRATRKCNHNRHSCACRNPGQQPNRH